MTIRSIEAVPIGLPYEIGGPKPLFAGKPRDMDILLVRVETELGEPEPVELWVVHPSRRLLPLRVRAAIDWLAIHRRKRLDARAPEGFPKHGRPAQHRSLRIGQTLPVTIEIIGRLRFG